MIIVYAFCYLFYIVWCGVSCGMMGIVQFCLGCISFVYIVLWDRRFLFFSESCGVALGRNGCVGLWGLFLCLFVLFLFVFLFVVLCMSQ